jgi:hypothetical protein
MTAVTLYQEELLSRDLEEGDAGDDFFNCYTGGAQGLGAARKSCKTPATVAMKAHAGQAFTIYIRQVAAQILSAPGRTLQFGFEGNHAVLKITPLVTSVEAPPWSPLGDGDERGTFKVLANVSKMGCPSFSLPAGPGSLGGACPGATQGMSVVNGQLHDNAGKASIRRLSMMPAVSMDEWFATAVCQHCYAAKASYAYFSKQLAQVAVFAWTQHAVKNGSFVPMMIEAIERSPWHKDDPSDRRHLVKHGYKRVFRLHDSGDFFSPEYVKAWRRIADHFMPGRGPGTPTIFWAPTRLWAAGTARDWLAAVGPAGDLSTNNMVVRPSAFHVNQHAPAPVLGESAGSTVHTLDEASLKKKRLFQFVCPASRKEEKNSTCLEVPGPDGKMGCRACWVLPGLTISYHIH